MSTAFCAPACDALLVTSALHLCITFCTSKSGFACCAASSYTDKALNLASTSDKGVLSWATDRSSCKTSLKSCINCLPRLKILAKVSILPWCFAMEEVNSICACRCAAPSCFCLYKSAHVTSASRARAVFLNTFFACFTCNSLALCNNVAW